ncbi:MAG: thioredoxin domain-containing protein [Coriobacteriia bacterium]
MTPAEETTRRANHLDGQASPYLRAHAHDPVDWVPWGERALRFARRTGRPLFVSSGYQACHWCHVMQRESFSDTDLAGFINRHFVPVKVDRETRPDVDAFYMTYLNLATGSGGWPMTVFATPEALPFYGGTYFPRRSTGGISGFQDVLDAVLRAWTINADATLETANEALETYNEVEHGSFGPITRTTLDVAATQLRDAQDHENGGFHTAPKFPTAPVVTFLTAYAELTGWSWPAEIALRQVLSMLRGGTFDHVGGGLFRYSTDERWHVPHFEKMLYDSALLLSSLANLNRLQPSRELAYYARATHAFLMRELACANGGFNSALNAETDGVEGASYVWTYDELEAELTAEELALARTALEVTEAGHTPEGENVLTRRGDRGEQPGEVDALLARLAHIRGRRRMPDVIDNVITSWNALAARGLIEAGRAFAEPDMVADGLQTLGWLLETALHRDKITHVVGDDSIKDVRFLEDYAALGATCLSAAEATEGLTAARYLDTAVRLNSSAYKAFTRDDGALAMSTGKTALPVAPLETDDNPTPSGAATLAENAVRIARAVRRMENPSRARGDVADVETARLALSQFGRTARVAPYLAGHALATAALIEAETGDT